MMLQVEPMASFLDHISATSTTTATTTMDNLIKTSQQSLIDTDDVASAAMDRLHMYVYICASYTATVVEGARVRG
jgi:hypothetical protein